MRDASDMELLREYARQNSEPAFAELVRRHIGLVYSAALRHVGMAAQAEEITQAVFVILARKAASLREGQILDAWLFETTRLTALSFLRGERRRQFREQEAYMQSVLQESTPDPVWQQLAPLLDEAMMRLGRRDREVVVLRFFKGRSLGEVAAALNIKEPAAQKRVSRALEKLRHFFAKRGVDSTASAIAEKISVHSVQAAPVALAKTISAVALVKGATASVSTLTLVKGALKIMAWTKAKTAIVVTAGVLLAAGTTTITVKEIQEHITYPWEVQNTDMNANVQMNVIYGAPAMVKIVPTKFDKSSGCSDNRRGAMGLAQPLTEIIQVAYRQDKTRMVVKTDLPTNRYDFIATAQNQSWASELQKRIAKQFGVVGNVETRDTPVLVLRPTSMGAHGFKISQTMPKGGPNAPAPSQGFSYRDQPISVLISPLQQSFHIPIVDQTGLKGHYDFSLYWDQPDWKHPNLDGLKQALLDQLGLELVPTNMPIRMLVIEKAK